MAPEAVPLALRITHFAAATVPADYSSPMDSRTAAHTLNELADLLELRGENRFKVRAYRSAARAVVALDTDDIGPLYRSGELAALTGVGPATLAVLADLVESGESRYLEQLRENLPEGLMEMVR